MYRRKPVEVEARCFIGANGVELAEWCGGEYFPDPAGPEGVWGDFINIRSEEGVLRANVGDWIVAERGWFWPMKPEIFTDIYEPVAVT